jgi:phospholipid/cholesterol/gamma-HCH transport system substrate-binding protein
VRLVRDYWKFAVFLLVSGGLTLWIAVQIAGTTFGAERYRLAASFADATNLRVGDPVRLSGVPVGAVTKVEVRMGQAYVEFDVDDTVELPVDSEVAVRAQNLLNVRELVLTPGEERAMLADGDRMTRVSSAVELGNLINELGPLLEAVDPEQVNDLVAALNQALGGNRERIAGLTGDFEQVLGNLASRSETIGQLVEDYAVVSAEAARRDRQIQQLVDNLVLLTSTFDESEQVLVQALATLPGFSERLAGLLRTNAGALDSILADVAALGTITRENRELLDDVLRLAPVALLELTTITDRGEVLVNNYLCVSDHPPPCEHPPTDGGSSSGDVFEELLRP